MEKILYLIPCCKDKGKSETHSSEKEFLREYLSVDYYYKIQQARKCCCLGKNIHLSGGFLPALEMYEGNLYKQHNVKEDIRNTIDFRTNHLLIISALYGVLHPDDYIQYYDLKMCDSIKYWKTVIPEVIGDYVIKNDITKIITILADKYLKVVENLHKNCSKVIEIEKMTFADGNSSATPRNQGVLLHNKLTGDNKPYSLALCKNGILQ